MYEIEVSVLKLVTVYEEVVNKGRGPFCTPKKAALVEI